MVVAVSLLMLTDSVHLLGGSSALRLWLPLDNENNLMLFSVAVHRTAMLVTFYCTARWLLCRFTKGIHARLRADRSSNQGMPD